VGDAPCDNPTAYVGGVLQFSFVIKGKRRHMIVYPDLPSPNRNKYSGVNAIHRTLPIINFLMQNKSGINVISNPNFIPERKNDILLHMVHFRIKWE
jgi:hypothetical protein